MIQAFFVEGHVYSWNEALRKHWRVWQKIKEDSATRTLQAVYKDKIKPMPGPVTIEVMAHWRTKRLRDLDNICIKGVVDLLVSEGILEGDTCDIVQKVTYLGKTGCKREGLSVIISSLDT